MSERDAPAQDELLSRLRRFHEQAFPQYQDTFRHLVEEGQHPNTLFIGCSDSRLVPYLLTGMGPGELFFQADLLLDILVDPDDAADGPVFLKHREEGCAENDLFRRELDVLQ